MTNTTSPSFPHGPQCDRSELEAREDRAAKYTPEQAIAEVRLERAAHDLLVALEECLAILRRAADDINDIHDTRYLTLVGGCRLARAAIAKATDADYRRAPDMISMLDVIKAGADAKR